MVFKNFIILGYVYFIEGQSITILSSCSSQASDQPVRTSSFDYLPVCFRRVENVF